MKLVFDTNVILDAVVRRKDAAAAQALLAAVAREAVVGVITANSVTDLYYISRKIIGDEKARSALSALLALFEVAAVDGEACGRALELPMKDLEDAVLAVCAKSAGATCIVTRDEALLRDADCPVPACRPEDALRMIQEGHPRE